MGTGDKHMPNVMHPRKTRKHTEVVEKKAGRTLTPRGQRKTAFKSRLDTFQRFLEKKR